MIRPKPKYRRVPPSKMLKRVLRPQDGLASSRSCILRILFGIFFGTSVAMMLATIYIHHEAAYKSLGRLRRILQIANDSDARTDYIIRTLKCHIPQFKHDDPAIMGYYFSSEPVTCNSTAKPFIFDYKMNLTEGRSCIALNREIFSKHYQAGFGTFQKWRCSYREPRRGNRTSRLDQSWAYGPSRDLKSGSCPGSEFLWISCASDNGDTIYEQPLALPMVKPAARVVVPNNRGKKPLHILVLGYDSISRLNAYRQLPKTLEFLRTKPHLVELFGYNKIGLNSAPNQIALLTGIRYLEPGLSSRVNGNYFDNLTRYLWQDFELRGYRTMFFEEQWKYGLFVYPPLVGFEKVQTTYWPRHWMEAIDQSDLKKKGIPCIGPDYPSKYYLKYIADTLRILGPDRPLFAYGWLSELAHDDVNGGHRIDEELRSFFKTLDETGVLDNTAVFFISDHGMRFGSFRQTEMGKHEDMLPFGFILMPQRFYDVYPEAAENLRTNSRRLVTVYDLYASLLELGDVWEERRVTKTGRGYSLFSSVVPDDRSCVDAGIDLEFCSCYEFLKLDIRSPLAASLTRAAIEKLNSAVEAANLTELCRVWGLSHVGSFDRLTEGDVTTNYYRMTFNTTPEADFEIMAEFTEKSWQLVAPIDRTSSYAEHAECTENSELKKYCYCIKDEVASDVPRSGSS